MRWHWEARTVTTLEVSPEEAPHVRALLRYPRRSAVLERRVRRLQARVDHGQATEEDRVRLLRTIDEMQGEWALYEEALGRGPCMSAIARVQVGMLRELEGKRRRGR